jgi:predicted nucleic acid-binding protein
MAQGILLDSSVVIPHLRGRLDLGAQVASSEPLFLPLTALGELYKGVFKSSQPQKNRLLLETFLQTVAVLYPDTATALYYAQISADLERKGDAHPRKRRMDRSHGPGMRHAAGHPRRPLPPRHRLATFALVNRLRSHPIGKTPVGYIAEMGGM